MLRKLLRNTPLPGAPRSSTGPARASSWTTVLAVALGFAFSAAAIAPARAQVNAQPQRLEVLGPGDTVTVQVFGEPESTPIYVAEDGTINAPYVGKVPVGGISPVEAANRLASALKNGGYFRDPHVTVMVTQSRSQLVSIIGEISGPGRYPITPRTSLIELLAQAGGLKEDASDIGYVVRTDEYGQTSRHPVNLNVEKESASAPSNFALLGGDSLIVPRAERFSIEGEVASPGSYKVEPGMTILQAIARAGGVNERGSERRVRVKRVDKPSGKVQTLSVKLNDAVKADDIIVVKESIF